MHEHWRLVSWTKAACPVADVELRSDVLKREYRECGAWRTETLTDIAALHPQLIVTSQADSLPGPAFSDSVWAAKTASTVSALRALAPTVFLQDTPHPVDNVPECLARNLAARGNCDLPGVADSSQRALADRGESVARALAGVDVRPDRPEPLVLRQSELPGDRREHPGLPRRQPHDPELQSRARARSPPRCRGPARSSLTQQTHIEETQP